LPAIKGLSAAELEGIYPDLKEAGRLFGTGKPLTNPWKSHQPDLQYSLPFRDDVLELVKRLREINTRHQEQVLQAGAGLEFVGNPARFRELASALLGKLRSIQGEAASDERSVLAALTRHLRRIPPEQHSEQRKKRIEQRKNVELAKKWADQVASTPLDATWDRRCGKLSKEKMQALLRTASSALEFEARWWRFMSPRFRCSRKLLRNFHANATNEKVWAIAQQIVDYHHAHQLRDQLAAANRRAVPGFRFREDEHSQIRLAQLALQELPCAEWLCAMEDKEPCIKSFLGAFAVDGDIESVAQFATKLGQTLNRLSLAEELLREMKPFEAYLKQEALDLPLHQIRAGESIAQWLADVEAGVEGIQNLMAWRHSRSQDSDLLSAVLSELVEYEQRRLANDRVPSPPPDLADNDYGRWWVALVKYSAALAWQNVCHKQHPILATLTPEAHAEKARELAALLANKRNLETESICATWLREQVKHRDAPWKRMFQLRRSKYGDAKRLREAVNLSLDHGLLAMRPCWLVNPATAAELFPLKPGLFDLVIFDEASQCPLEQAVPAIFRGNTVVVSGDEKQLPPTSFFSSSWTQGQTDGDEHDEEEEATETVVAREQQMQTLSVEYLLQVEDLLAAAIGSLPERFLSVHYRSRHPALIEFSNRAFYSGRLEAPPAQTSSVNGYRPIRYHTVNGLYDRQTNRDEARHVVKVLRDLWATDGLCPTAGIVTFNRPQRYLIEDLLEEECLRDDWFASRYRQEVEREEDNQDVGLFVKNLENVQGDERDVVIFSTTFGRDSAGRFDRRRFGPVGAVGGERRLNVAVTRAKQQVVLPHLKLEFSAGWVSLT